jgi:hypothetical protein
VGRTKLFNRVKQQAHYFYACIIAHVGMLSHWIQKSMQDETNVYFLLVDRASTRYKVGTITVHYTVIINLSYLAECLLHMFDHFLVHVYKVNSYCTLQFLPNADLKNTELRVCDRPTFVET